MDPHLQDIQKQLVRCQQALDTARQEGWSAELVEEFYQATQVLHEGAIVRRASGQPPTHQESFRTNGASESKAEEDSLVDETAVNRLLTAEELEESSEPADTQVDLLSSIGELTLAEKLALQPLTDVSEGMSIVDRAQFTSVLFSGEEEVFSSLLTKLSRAATQEEAFAQFQQAMSPRGEEGEVEALKEEFAKRIMRTFVS